MYLSLLCSSAFGLFVLKICKYEKCDEHIWCKEAAQPRWYWYHAGGCWFAFSNEVRHRSSTAGLVNSLSWFRSRSDRADQLHW